jgi:hypothetical protein
MTGPRLPAEGVAGLRSALVAAGYTVDGVLDLLGPHAYGALGRGETVPALRTTTGGSPLETLTRLFVLQAPVRLDAVRAALPDLDGLVGGGLVAVDGAEVHALVDVRPYAADTLDAYVVSDLGTGIGGVSGPVTRDHVLGIGGASTTLAQITVRPTVGRALDIGTGCGVQALHLVGHADRVVATDRNPRALAMAGLTAGLSGMVFDLREGSLYEPVAGERFDLIVSNPPFVVALEARFTYRDSGLPGDEVGRRLVTQAPAYLADGGWIQVLANWLHVEGEDWRERLAGWVVPTGCDAWVVQREVQDPAEYAELWLRDAGDHTGPDYARRYDQWLQALADDRVEGIGFGWITLHASGAEHPVTRIEEIRHPVQQPLGEPIRAWFDRQDRLRSVGDDDLLATALVVDPQVRLDQEWVPSSDGLALLTQRLRQAGGLRRSGEVDEVGAEVVAGCNGRPLRAVLADVAGRLGVDEAELRAGAVPAVRTLLEEGFLTFPT